MRSFIHSYRYHGPETAQVAPFRAAFPLVPLIATSIQLLPFFEGSAARPACTLSTIACKGAYTTGPLDRLPHINDEKLIPGEGIIDKLGAPDCSPEHG